MSGLKLPKAHASAALSGVAIVSTLDCLLRGVARGADSGKCLQLELDGDAAAADGAAGEAAAGIVIDPVANLVGGFLKER